ncbi:MAG: ribosomal protein S18-alanine N-acetyltransferase [Clostridia bacterium]|nr:ribosomal protein S18-alanine N-acetyltransferase [Clostridia bacterium]
MTISINEMTGDTARLVAGLEAKCFSDPWPYESFINTLANEHAQYYTIHRDYAFVGYIGMYNLIDEVSIINVAIEPAYRGTGYGRMLMERAEDFAKNHGCPMITLEVRESNTPARRLYEVCGYQAYAVQKNYYTNPKEDAVLYRKAVNRLGMRN